ncbi:hypothetical protein ND861_19160, partial [Leptospira sp. 2 VSF19]
FSEEIYIVLSGGFEYNPENNNLKFFDYINSRESEGPIINIKDCDYICFDVNPTILLAKINQINSEKKLKTLTKNKILIRDLRCKASNDA